MQIKHSKYKNTGILFELLVRIKRQKYNLINEIKKSYNLTHFFNHKLPNYKPFAAFYTLIELNNSTTTSPDQLIQNKITILEHLTVASIKESKVRDEVMDEVNKSDKDTKLLTYKILMEKFNGKYDTLASKQKLILKEYVNSIDNAPRLKTFYIDKVNEIKNELTELNKNTKSKVTKIKINEIVSLIKVPQKNYKLKDKDLVDLLQYCDLVDELETANG